MDRIGFDHFARVAPEELAIIDGRGRAWSRGELAALVNRLSRALRRAGLRPGDVIAVIAPNSAEFLAAYLATTQIGLYFVPINYHLLDKEIEHIVACSSARALLIHARHCRALTPSLRSRGCLPTVRISIGPAEEFDSLESITARESDDPLEDAIAGRSLIFTSATTGYPKAVHRPLADAEAARHRLLELIRSMSAAAGIEPGHDGAHLCQSQLYHTAPLDCTTSALHLGHTVVLMERWDPEKALHLIERHLVRATVMVPAMFTRLLRLPEDVRRRYSVKSLKLVSHGGAPCPVEVKRQMIEWWGPVLQEVYGAAEGGGTAISSVDWLRKPGSVGRAYPGAAIRILNEDGEELPSGTAGAIYIRSFTGDRFEYLGEPDKTANAHRGEFFSVGDVGYLDEEGFLYICDRKIDIIITGGVNVYSAEVERVLLLHPAVADCAVFGIPDALLGECILAVVEPSPQVVPDRHLTTELLAFLARCLTQSKIPRRIEYVRALGRDPAGKLLKRRLREPYWRGLERPI